MAAPVGNLGMCPPGKPHGGRLVKAKPSPFPFPSAQKTASPANKTSTIHNLGAACTALALQLSLHTTPLLSAPASPSSRITHHPITHHRPRRRPPHTLCSRTFCRSLGRCCVCNPRSRIRSPSLDLGQQLQLVVLLCRPCQSQISFKAFTRL